MTLIKSSTLGGKDRWVAGVREDETQETITQWGEETFGPTHPQKIATRMSKEVEELLELFRDKVQYKPMDSIDPEIIQELHIGCADVEIMLRRVAELLHLELQDGVNFKMSVNRRRRLGWDEKMTQTRHITEFKEEGSGIIMRLDLWYVLSDSGSAYSPEGFDEREQALNWARSNYVCTEFGHNPEDVGAPPWDPEEKCWNDNGDGGFGINVLYGRDLYDFWENVHKIEGL